MMQLASYHNKSHSMPYRSVNELPSSVKSNLPHHAQEIFMAAFNSAYDQYGNEERAMKVAWGAVKKKYQKDDNGEWVEKDS